MKTPRKLFLVLSCLYFLIGTPHPVFAQRDKQPVRKFQEGDEIEYNWGSSWYPGVVLQVEGNMVGIEYQSGSAFKRDAVPVYKLRHAWEAKALTPMRFWRDQSGQFKIRAAAVGIKDGFVKLHKDDGSEISVEISKLSTADQSTIARYKKAAGPPVAEKTPTVSFSRSSSWGHAWVRDTNLQNVPPDSPPSFAKIPMAGVAFPKAHFHEDLIRVQPIGGSDGWVVAATVDGMSKLPSRILWASLSSQKIKRLQLLPPAERLVAVDPPSRQLLTVNTQNRDAPVLSLWKSDPTMETAESVKSWPSVATERWGSWNNWAAIVSPTRVLHEWGKHQFVVWDVDKEQEVYHIEQESFFSARPTLSPGKRYIALPEDKRLRIIEAATGDTKATLPVEGGSSAGVGFSPDGKRLAVLTRSQLAVWTLGSANEPQRFRADSIGTPFSAIVEWVDENSLLIDRKTLFDTRLEMPVWSYSTKTFEVKRDSYGERTMTVLDDKLCYAVKVDKAFVVGAVDLPGPAVRETVETLDPESLFILRRGSHVSIKVNCGPHNSRVDNSLLEQIKDNGWIYDANSSTVLVAEMGRSKTQTVNYRMTNYRTGDTYNQSVTVTPYYSRLKLMHNGVLAWSASGGSGVPPLIHLNQGQSAQAEADAMQKPDPGLFRRVDIPEKIYDPAKKNGLGSSLISARGLTPTVASSTPPAPGTPPGGSR